MNWSIWFTWQCFWLMGSKCQPSLCNSTAEYFISRWKVAQRHFIRLQTLLWNTKLLIGSLMEMSRKRWEWLMSCPLAAAAAVVFWLNRSKRYSVHVGDVRSHVGTVLPVAACHSHQLSLSPICHCQDAADGVFWWLRFSPLVPCHTLPQACLVHSLPRSLQRGPRSQSRVPSGLPFVSAGALCPLLTPFPTCVMDRMNKRARLREKARSFFVLF